MSSPSVPVALPSSQHPFCMRLEQHQSLCSVHANACTVRSHTKHLTHPDTPHVRAHALASTLPRMRRAACAGCRCWHQRRFYPVRAPGILVGRGKGGARARSPGRGWHARRGPELVDARVGYAINTPSAASTVNPTRDGRPVSSPSAPVARPSSQHPFCMRLDQHQSLCSVHANACTVRPHTKHLTHLTHPDAPQGTGVGSRTQATPPATTGRMYRWRVGGSAVLEEIER